MRRTGWILLLSSAPALIVAGMTSSIAENPAACDRPAPGRVEGQSATPSQIESAAIENLYRLSPRLFSGGQPLGERGFEELQLLGIKTIISVDGARPDVAEAQRLGMRYIHIPVGYDGVPRAQAVRMIKVLRDLPGPIFIHCHHGKHRGPAVAALCGLASEDWSRDQALAWLKKAGTDPKYLGLFDSVGNFRLPSREELDQVGVVDLPEQAEVPALVETMVRIDALWDHLKEIQGAGFRTPPGHRDLDPPHEALMLSEHFREASRLDQTRKKGEEFARMMQDAERATAALEAALREAGKDPSPAATRKAEETFKRTGDRCTSCHSRFRDN